MVTKSSPNRTRSRYTALLPGLTKLSSLMQEGMDKGMSVWMYGNNDRLRLEKGWVICRVKNKQEMAQCESVMTAGCVVGSLPGDGVGCKDEGYNGEKIRPHDDEENKHIHQTDARHRLRLWVVRGRRRDGIWWGEIKIRQQHVTEKREGAIGYLGHCGKGVQSEDQG